MRDCLNASTLQAWLDGELSLEASVAARSHLAGCAVCAAQARAAEKTLALVDDAWQAGLPDLVPTARLRTRFTEGLTAQAARADRWWWWRIASGHWRLGATIVVLAVVAVAGAVTIRLRQIVPPPPRTAARVIVPEATAQPPAPQSPVMKSAMHSGRPPVRNVRPLARSVSKPPTPRSTWLESETNRHIGQTQLLLRSVRNAEAETLFDLAYERELSRELLARNRLLRRRAEVKDEARMEELLIQIEPLLLDIANLTEQLEPEEMRSLKELIRDQQIIAELQLYAGKNLF